MRSLASAVRLAAFALAACGLCLQAAEPKDKPVERLLPAGTLFYVSYKNPAGLPGWKDSAPCRAIEQPEMKAFLEQARAAFARLREQARAKMPLEPELLEEMLSREITVAFTGMRTNEQKQQEFGLVITTFFERPAHEAEQQLIGALRKAAQGMLADPQPAFVHNDVQVKYIAVPTGILCYAFVDGRFVLTMGELAMREVLKLRDGEGQCLADDATFKAVMDRVGGTEGVLVSYMNNALFFTQFGQFMPPRQVAFFEAVGAYKVKASAFCSRFADGGMRDAAYILAPGERSGLLPAAGNPVDVSLLRQVPREATIVSLRRMNLKGIYGTLMRMIANTDPEKFKDVMAKITEFEQKAGFKIGADLLGSLGSQWLFYQSPRESVLMVELKDAAKFETCLGGLVGLAEGKAVLRQTDFGGTPIKFLAITENPVPLSPAYAVVDGWAVFALYPQTLKGFLANRGKERPSILDNPDFQRVAGKYLKGCDAVGYADAGVGLLGLYEGLVMLSPALHGVKEVSLSPELLPHPDVFAPCVFGAAGGCVNDADGILYEWYSPCGIAGHVLGMAGAVVGHATRATNYVNVPLLGALVLPAMANARAEGRKAACMSNCKQLAVACAAYAADNGDLLPEKLEDLVPNYLGGAAALLVCPEDKNPMPIGNNLKTSYYYVGRLPAGTRPEVIILYEKAGNHRKGMRTVAFADGHVETMADEALKGRLRQSLNTVKQNQWETVPHERRKEIEAFYAGK
jgi:prepilin-type processing-associated H-X9-DG protein